MLACFAAKLVYKTVEINIIQRPRDRISRKAENAQHVSAHLEIAQVSGNDQQRPIFEQQSHKVVFVCQFHEIAPVGLVDFSRGVGHFQDQEEKMFPHLPLEPLSGRAESSGKAWTRLSSSTPERIFNTSQNIQASNRAIAWPVSIRTVWARHMNNPDHQINEKIDKPLAIHSRFLPWNVI